MLDTNSFQAARDSLNASRRPSLKNILGLNGASACWFFAGILAHRRSSALWVVPSVKEADRVEADLSFFSPVQVMRYPVNDALPFMPVLPSPVTSCQRLSCLYRIATGDEPVILVATVQALMELTLPRKVLLDNVEYLVAGEEIERQSFIDWLVLSGYERTSMVQARGEFSVRGEIIDIFPPSVPFPVRIDFFDELIEGIRLFNPLTQRSLEEVDELIVLPASEILFFDSITRGLSDRLIARAIEYQWPGRRINELLHRLESKRNIEGLRALLPIFYEKPCSLLDYLPHDLPIIMEDSVEIGAMADTFWESARDLYDTAQVEGRVLSRLEELIVNPAELRARLRGRIRWDIGYPEAARSNIPGEVFNLSVHRPDLPLMTGNIAKGHGLLGPIFDRLKQWREDGKRICIVTPGASQEKRLLGLMGSYGLIPNGRQDDPSGNATSRQAGVIVPESPGIYLFSGQLSQGFEVPFEDLVFLTEEDILGIHLRKQARPRKKEQLSTLTFEDLKENDPVVHRDHGIGIYRGLVRMEAGGVPGEYLLLEYAGGDKLYLPVDRLGLVQKYVGVKDKLPRLDRLGGTGWQLRKKKVKRAIYEVAHDLVELYAARKVQKGTAFSPPDTMFRQFEAEFPYEETDDQARAIDDILSDMQEPKPMDRLLCGDVGFGKTEVAMRAAFKAVEDGKQVAVLVPTTLLAEQHERTFKDRFRHFPVTIASISRLKNSKQIRDILDKTARGQVDILIGTHRLLQSDVLFKGLGLLIVDEEHRFGVKHKERLKNLKKNVDCLTLTATPIPRTLQLSLLGIRDLSTINTPPRDRVPIKTFLAQYDDVLISSVINKELERGGQIFFVHNRVKGIYRLMDHLKGLVPRARIDVAHGQMTPSELERVMIDFVRGRIDCLVCTTIIESGIDIPTANTMIINRADKLGLADLYQLRGRVGRGAEQAFAYFMVPDLEHMGNDARKRLRALMDMSTSGGGLRLAMQDLKIRGAGNILGVSQSGQIADVGYDLYLDLLQKAVEELKGTVEAEEIEPEVNLGIPAMLPEGYVPDVGERLHLYRRIAHLRDDHEVVEFGLELEDRFGRLPQEARNLLGLVGIKRQLRKINAIRLDRGHSGGKARLIVCFGVEGPPAPDKLLKAVQERKKWGLLPDSRLFIEIEDVIEDDQVLQSVEKWLPYLVEAATN